jgi:hypothetical protein
LVSENNDLCGLVQNLTGGIKRAKEDAELALSEFKKRARQDPSAIISDEVGAAAAHFAQRKLVTLADDLMRPQGLEAEFSRMWDLMPTAMEQQVRSTASQWDARLANPKHPGHIKWFIRRRAILHHLMASILKARNSKVVTVLHLAQAMDQFYGHIGTGQQQLMQRLGDSIHHTTLAKVRARLNSWIPSTPFMPFPEMRLIFLDNLDMYERHSHNRIKDGVVIKNSMLHAIVLGEELLDPALFQSPAPVGSLFYDREESVWSVAGSLPTEEAVTTRLADLFTGYMFMARDDLFSLLERPTAHLDCQKPGASPIISLPIQAGMHSNSTVDMAEVYMRLDEIVGKECYKLVVLDWQTFAVSWNLKERSAGAYQQYMWWGGELHRQMHSNDAILSIWWEHVIKPSAMYLRRNEVKLKFNADQFNSREQFVRLVATAVFGWLVSLDAPQNLWVEPTRMLDAVKANLPAAELIHFALHAGTFALSDKFAMRRADNDALDWGWQFTSILARACNKTNYAKYGIMMNRVLNDTHPWVKGVIHGTRTYRASSKPCTGVGKDTGTEKVQIDL